MKLTPQDMDGDDAQALEKLQALLDKYANDNCTDEERQAVEQWYESLAGDRETTVLEEHEARARVWANLKQVAPLASDQHDNDTPSLWPRLKWAAAIALLAVAGLFTWRQVRENKSGLANDAFGLGWTVKTNAHAVEEQLVLPDGSRVTLQPNASIEYPKTFEDHERVVKFTGEAFFNIEKDSERPFKVLTGDIVTRVLGTSFLVKVNAVASVVEVDVRTGSVSVYDNAPAKHAAGGVKEGVILTPNQKVTYYKDDDKWVTELVKNPMPVVSEVEKIPALVYRNRVMRNVLEDVAALYQIEILVSNDRIYGCPFTGDLSEMGLHDVLKVICKSIGADYETKGTRILLSGPGCATGNH
ncbi:FecR family protein [Chryseolinea lacunae]|uniref:FecR family protein n=1 Tax=Chryseolinea lacunae TaxID=2801331 RepID=A0ABS1KMN2_9BACT|nr:FecR family protein [Chryseolinea lacunae]MBL0740588.1 FecR family protein [Chryseolinea lacunae]